MKEKNAFTNEAKKVLAKKVNEATPVAVSAESENVQKGKAVSKKQSKQSSFEKDLLEMQEKMQQLRLEKEKTEELLKEKDEMLKQKEQELDERGRQQEKLQIELKKLHKLKEFKPTMVTIFPFLFYLFTSLKLCF